jgi:hypothetical protein
MREYRRLKIAPVARRLNNRTEPRGAVLDPVQPDLGKGAVTVVDLEFSAARRANWPPLRRRSQHWEFTNGADKRLGSHGRSVVQGVEKVLQVGCEPILLRVRLRHLVRHNSAARLDHEKLFAHAIVPHDSPISMWTLLAIGHSFVQLRVLFDDPQTGRPAIRTHLLSAPSIAGNSELQVA